MKNSFCLKTEEVGPYHDIARFDHDEIDNPDRYSLSRINYVNRINKVIDIVKKHILPSAEAKIADFGCAQGNTALMLAEMGYKVYAIDMRKEFMEYSRLKYRKGDIKYICANIEDCAFHKECFDVVIMGELIEHCAFPENVVSNALKFLKRDGMLIITTPNGWYLRNSLPLFSSLGVKERDSLKAKQYGPDGADHLFSFSIKDVESILSGGWKITDSGYLGTEVLNRFTMTFLRVLDISTLNSIIAFFEHLSFLNKYLSHGIYCVIRHEDRD